MDGKTAAVRKQAEEKINFNFIHVETAPKSSLSWGNTRVKYPSCLLLPCCSAYFFWRRRCLARHQKVGEMEKAADLSGYMKDSTVGWLDDPTDYDQYQ